MADSSARATLEVIETVSGKDEMRVCIDKSRQYNSPSEMDDLRIARLLLDLIARADDVDLAVANQHSTVANDREIGHFVADTRTLRT